MKRKYTCILQGEKLPDILVFSNRKQVDQWIKLNGVEMHSTPWAEGQLIHAAGDKWALIVAGPLCAIKEAKSVNLLVPGKAHIENPQLPLGGVE